ncbi:MAG: hypothetical protein ACOYEV_18295 [Candidatus Nanopelagicales bacterium]
MSARSGRAGIAICVSSALFLAGGPAIADSTRDSGIAETVSQAIEAVAPDAELGEPIDLTTSGADLIGTNAAGIVAAPQDPTAPVVLGSDDAIGVGLPDLEGLAAPQVAADGTVVYKSSESAQVAVQAFDQGVRFLAVIGSQAAPERYAFPIVIPDGGGVALTETGSVDITDADGSVIATAPVPWAHDADGGRVPTHFEIKGTTLTQVVDHVGGGFSYPIVADPALWQIVRCVAAIAWVIGTTVFMAAKLIKIRAFINSVGGLTQTAKLLMGATTAHEKSVALGQGLAAVASALLGIDTVASNCRS